MTNSAPSRAAFKYEGSRIVPAGQGTDYEDFKKMCTGKKHVPSQVLPPPCNVWLKPLSLLVNRIGFVVCVCVCVVCARSVCEWVKQPICHTAWLCRTLTNLLRLCAVSPIGFEFCNCAVRALNVKLYSLHNLFYILCPFFCEEKHFRCAQGWIAVISWITVQHDNALLLVSPTSWHSCKFHFHPSLPVMSFILKDSYRSTCTHLN